MNWFRVYHDIIDDPKVLALSRENRWNVLALFSISSKQNPRGKLPSLRDIAIHLRLTERKTQLLINILIAEGFIDTNHDQNTLYVHGWNNRQYKSDDSYERVKRFRNGKRNVSVTPRARSETEADTDTEETPPNPPLGGPCVCASSQPPQNGNGKHPDPETKPAPEPGPEFTHLGNLAIEMSADLSMGAWVVNMGRLGHSAPAIRYSLEQAAAARQWSHKWLLGILKRVAVDGLPTNGTGAQHKTAVDIDAEVDALEAKYNARREADRVQRERSAQKP